ncbi:MAG: ATP-dependent DNA helicase RecG [Verrucomicrobiales bacterium]|nr:ATP-dependent DNA helicase RecG [Verrucomicrobiales bacterium]
MCHIPGVPSPADSTLSPVTLLEEWIPLLGGRGGRGLDKKTAEGLDSLGLVTVDDLLEHFPRRYEDRVRFDRFPNQPTDRPLCLRGEVTDAQQRFMPGRRRLFEATLEDPSGDVLSGRIVLRWFNMPYIHKLIAVGQELVVFGQPREKGRRLVIDHPDYEIIEREHAGEPGAAGIHMDRIVPVYRLTNGVSQRFLRALLFQTLEAIVDEDLPDRFPEATPPEPGWFRARALRAVHFPRTFEDLGHARRFLALEEFAQLQLGLLRRRALWESAGGVPHAGPGALLERFIASLPFPLTGAQVRAIAEVRADLSAARPMNRLLQGDVGAGKTLVATAAMLLAVEAGFDGALMAPTQILAEQHFRNLRGWLEPLGVTVKLRTGSRRDDGEALPLFASTTPPGTDGFGSITVGTHALIHGDGSDFDRPLGVVVIDEQHKFGVAQREALVAQGDRPDLLIMTATPIPRTLTLSVYGDLDVSILDELPAGRGKIITGIRDTAKTEAAAQFLRDQLAAGRQAYIVYPLIEESEKVKSAAVTAEFETWQRRLDGYSCGLLHGRLGSEEKDAVMEAFRRGDLQVLIATTVIEVGVDVPNASVMFIYGAERFGLAQLHQLRGRIGRGAHKSYCILMLDAENAEAASRLRILEETRDGFRIAEADLAIRGPGEVLGTAQSGLPDLKFPEFLTDPALLQQARELAKAHLAGKTGPG